MQHTYSPISNFRKATRFTKLSFIAIALCAAALTLSCTDSARSIARSGLGQAADPVPFTEAARHGTLPSGLRYYLLENSMPEGRAFLTLAVDAGSILETDEEQGLAHFVEHMAFNGTVNFPDLELINYLRTLGMRFGADVNAYTSFDETVYGIEVPVERRDDGSRIIPDIALSVIDDWSQAITFYEETVENERRVMIEEYRFRLGARERISREMFSVLFRDSLYAERLPIGQLSVLESATAEQLEAFYRLWYRSENMAVIIVGDFDVAELEAQLSRHFPQRESDAAIDPEPFYRPRHDLRPPEKGSLEALVITDDELSRSRVDLYWKRSPERPRSDLAAYRESIIDNLADTMLSLRFQEAAIRPEMPYVFAAGGTVDYGYTSRFYVLMAQAKAGSVQDALRELLTMRETLVRHGFSQSELDLAKTMIVSFMAQQLSEKDRQHSEIFVSSFTKHFLRNESVPSVEWEVDAVNRLLPAISLREVNQRVRSYFAEDDLTAIVSAPEDEVDLPTSMEIKAIASEVRKARINRFEFNRVQGDLLPFTPEAGVIDAETLENGALRWRLGNGAEVILKKTENRNNEISLLAQARGGVLNVPDESAVSASLAAEMLNASGLGEFRLTELTKLLADKQVSFSYWAQNHLRGFRGSAAAQDIATLFQMIHLSFTQPRFDPDAVQVALDQLQTSLTFQQNDPSAVFRREISRTTHGNARFHPIDLEDLDRFNADDALEFIRSSLNPADFTFVVTGNIDVEYLRSLTETYLASIPSAPELSSWRDIDPQRPPHTSKEVRMGREQQSTVYLGWFIPQPYSEEDGAAVSALSEYLDIRLIDQIREAMGGVYTISSWVSLSPIPSGELSGGVFFVCDPQRVDELVEAVHKEFRAIAIGALDSEVFGKAIEALVQGHDQAIQSNAHIAQSYANSAVIFRSPLSRLDRRPALFRSVRPSDLSAIMTKLLQGTSVRMVLLPESGG